jgi:ribosomal protein L23
VSQTHLIIIQLSPEELRQIIEEATANVLAKSHQSSPEEDKIMGRKDIAELFGVSLTTINTWSRTGKLKRRYMGAKVYFLKSEVVALLKKNDARTTTSR